MTNVLKTLTSRKPGGRFLGAAMNIRNGDNEISQEIFAPYL